MVKTIRRISVLGAGNLAAHLVPALVNSGVRVAEVLSRKGVSAFQLAGPLGIPHGKFPGPLDMESQAILLAVSDDAIPGIVRQMEVRNKILIHTSGSTPASALSGATDNYGVLYPLQTFSRSRPVDFRKVPVFIEAANPATLRAIRELAMKLSSTVTESGPEMRMWMHISAVFASNFQNHLYRVAEEILKRNGLPFSSLEPLIRETLEKALETGPAGAQTGPGIRRDHNTMKKHLEHLSSDPAWKDIYSLLSDDIMRMNPKKINE